MQRKQMAPEIVQTQRKSSFKESMWTQSEPYLRESQLAQRESRSFRWSSPQVQVGVRHLPRLIDRCHELRRLDRSFRYRRLLGDVRPPRRIPLF
jgi:hypothetical protein